jgi:hypothetical protein
MSTKGGLSLRLYLEGLDSRISDILITELGSGRLLGSDQSFSLDLVSLDEPDILEDFRQEVQDCAFPLIKELSCCHKSSDQSRAPDLILVVLSSRDLPYSTDTPKAEEFHRLLGLVNYINSLSHSLSMLELDNVKIIIAGDLALTAASVLSHKLKKLSANQLLAIEPQNRDQPKMVATPGRYRKANTICEMIKQWWSGLQTSALMFLGVKHTDPGWRGTKMAPGTGYFFSTAVSLTGHLMFANRADLHIDHDHIAEVKATNDYAFRILQEMDGKVKDNSVPTWALL